MKMRQPPEGLDTDTLSVIEAARSGYEPSEMSRARVRRGVEIKLAAGIALAVGPATATSAFAGALKITAAVVTVSAVVGAGVYVYPHVTAKPAAVRAPVTRVASRPAPVVQAPPVEIEAPAPVVSPPRAPAKRRAPVAAAPVAVENVSGLKEETALLGAANAALARGDVKQAQALLADYDHRPGAAMLSQERAVTGILAWCAAGQADAARAAARQFRTRWPRSPLGARVDGSCAGAADPARLKP
jgi:hypothetical protein